ncbi:MAG: hypothetical protein K5986_05290, partial [Clostridium sp.]|nr:hypothetical protein [Clostridium sp.]
LALLGTCYLLKNRKILSTINTIKNIILIAYLIGIGCLCFIYENFQLAIILGAITPLIIFFFNFIEKIKAQGFKPCA